MDNTVYEPISEFEELLDVYETDKNFVEVYLDDCPYNPLDNLNTFYFYMQHWRYDLGNIAEKYDDCSNWNDVKERLETDYDIAMMLPVYMYEHGGIFFSTSPCASKWDNGQVGFIFFTKEQAKSFNNLEELLTYYVNLLTDYTLGNVYIITVRDKQNFHDYETYSVFKTDYDFYMDDIKEGKVKELNVNQYKQLWAKEVKITRIK